MKASEFDKFADEYYAQHSKNIGITGESPEYFAEYKIAEIAQYVESDRLASREIIDFGSGIGNSVPYFRKHFPDAIISCSDVSERSLELAQSRFPGGNERQLLIKDNRIPAEDDSYDLAFSACVFHHIDHSEHETWLSELRRVVRPGGRLFIFEHNPLNPLTVRAVNTCPFDVNARLIRAPKLVRASLAAGWHEPEIRYCVYFPRALSGLRPLEKYLARVPLGAQYYLVAKSK